MFIHKSKFREDVFDLDDMEEWLRDLFENHIGMHFEESSIHKACFKLGKEFVYKHIYAWFHWSVLLGNGNPIDEDGDYFTVDLRKNTFAAMHRETCSPQGKLFWESVDLTVKSYEPVEDAYVLLMGNASNNTDWQEYVRDYPSVY